MKSKRLAITSSASEILAKVSEATLKKDYTRFGENDVLELVQEANTQDISEFNRTSDAVSNTIPTKTLYNNRILANKGFTYEDNRGNVDIGVKQQDNSKLHEENKLISKTTEEATSTILNQLKQAVTKKDHLRLNSQATVEDIVTEILKPQLKEWLDQNLPSIVKTIVEKEVKKLISPED